MMNLARGMARGTANFAKTRRGKFAMGAGAGLGGMAALRGRSSGTNGLQARSSGGVQ